MEFHAVRSDPRQKGDTLILAPCNTDYDPIISDDEGVMILGEYVGVYHSEI